MKVSIWQQFSSNHSSYFIVVGRFATLDDAADNGHQLRDWMYRMMWGQDREAAEQEIRSKYGIAWYENGISWYWPTTDADVVQCVQTDVFLMSTENQYDSQKPFIDLMEAMGATNIWSYKGLDTLIQIQLTVNAPSEQVAIAFCDALKPLEASEYIADSTPIWLSPQYLTYLRTGTTVRRQGRLIDMELIIDIKKFVRFVHYLADNDYTDIQYNFDHPDAWWNRH